LRHFRMAGILAFPVFEDDYRGDVARLVYWSVPVGEREARTYREARGTQAP